MDLTAPLDTLDATGVTGMIERLRELGGPVDEAEAIDEIAALERLKSAAAAAQARVTAALREGRLAREMDAGMPAAERGRGLGDEIGLARRESATLGSRHLGLARALVAELPCTLAHLAAGTVSEWGATLLAKETAVLDPDDRRRIDAELADRLATMTPRQIERAARAMALAIDSRAMARRRARATADRRVSIRPQPDTMATVTGLLPVEQGVAAWAALRRDAEAAKAAGDERGIGQLMADLFVERLTGQAAADAVPVEVQLVMSPGTLLGLDDVPASLPGHGPLPAGLARDLVLGVDGAGDDGVGDEEESGRAWLRRMDHVASDSLGTLIERMERTLARENIADPELMGQLDEIKDWRNLLCHATWQPEATGWKPLFVNTRGEVHDRTMDESDLAAIRAMTLDAARRAGRLIEGLDEGSGASD